MAIDPIGWIAQGAQNLAGMYQTALGTAYNFFTDRQNRKWQADQNAADRAFQQSIYDQQRAHAESDWARQNAYDSPEQQMQRWREAGLNPNLMYGQGTLGQTIRSSSPGSGSQPAKKMNPELLSDALDRFYRINNQGAQTDNLRKQAEVLEADKQLKYANVAKVMVDTSRSEYDLDLATELREDVIRAARLANTKTNYEIEKLNVDIHFQLREDERRQLANTANVQKTLNEILESKLRQAKNPLEIQQLQALIRQTNSSARINEIDAALRAQGIGPNDPAWMRIMVQQLIGEGLGKDLTE